MAVTNYSVLVFIQNWLWVYQKEKFIAIIPLVQNKRLWIEIIRIIIKLSNTRWFPQMGENATMIILLD